MKARASAPRIPHDGVRRALLDHDDIGILLIDPQGRVAEANAAALQLLGTTAARTHGEPASELLRTVVSGDDPVADAFRSKASEREAVLHARGGAEVPVLLRSRRIGKPPWLVMAIRDLSQSRRMQQELRRHERLATLGQLSTGVAHEIRNPLTGIGTSAQVLLGRFEPRDERARFVRVILDEVARLDRIVNSLLQYARPREPELKPTALATCIEHVLELAADPVERAGVRVELDVARGLGPVYIDPDLVTQVLLNVTLNAVQAMPQGGRLRYEVRRVRRRGPPRGAGRRASDRSRRNGRAVARPWSVFQQVRVIDTGVGIPRGILSKLFDPFFSTKPGGTGLGLSICQTIMHEHGGSIAAASREGRGTTVLLDFPVEKRHGERRRTDSDAKRAKPAHR
ncbi:MAG TPA: ATP-binding protein [Candidatus Eisenbacteria bacterium]|nr:ATP-binding protein [Candidatus Eisenbacteria bacterium]